MSSLQTHPNAPASLAYLRLLSPPLVDNLQGGPYDGTGGGLASVTPLLASNLCHLVLLVLLPAVRDDRQASDLHLRCNKATTSGCSRAQPGQRLILTVMLAIHAFCMGCCAY
jgi:hypothetical protein